MMFKININVCIYVIQGTPLDVVEFCSVILIGGTQSKERKKERGGGGGSSHWYAKWCREWILSFIWRYPWCLVGAYNRTYSISKLLFFFPLLYYVSII